VGAHTANPLLVAQCTERRLFDELTRRAGDGVSQELERAMALFKQAAEVGHAPSQQEVGLRLLSGLGAKVDALLNPVLEF
jgi:TPR repeat protein